MNTFKERIFKDKLFRYVSQKEKHYPGTSQIYYAFDDRELLQNLALTKQSLWDMIEFFCPKIISNYWILKTLESLGGEWETYNGKGKPCYLCEGDNQLVRYQIHKLDEKPEEPICEIKKCFLITEDEADSLSTFTNCLILYNVDLVIYVLVLSLEDIEKDDPHWKKIGEL